jgi:two-component system sensor histidine kinase AtoS
MRFRPFNKTIMSIPRFVPLRYRFIVTTAGMLVFILGALALVLGYQQSRTIKQQLEKRGLAIAQSLAAVSIADLMTYNYISLERSANQAAKHPDIIYVIFHDKEGRVAGFSGRSDLQGKFLNDKVTRNTLAAKAALIQDVKLAQRQIPALEIAFPILLPKTQQQWGTVRVSLSLALMYQQLRQTRWTIFMIGLVALACGTLVSVWAARRITRPLDRLVRGTREAARGNLSQDIRVSTGDEIEVLAANFDVMIREIIAHREQLEKQLQEIKRLQRYTEQLLTTMSDGLLTVDMSGRISVINPAAAILLGMTDGETMNRCHISDCLTPYPTLDRYVGEVIANPGDRQPQEIQLPGENETRSLLVSCSLLKNRKDRPQEIILNLHDITSLKKLEASIRQAERLAALGTLAAGMAHEIRNPLSSIKTFVQLLPQKIEKPGFLEKFQRTVPRELNRINALVEDLLDLARVPKYVFQSTDLKTLLEQALDATDAQLQAGHIQCLCVIADDMPPVRADANQLVRAFHNLIRNAVQAMPQGGKLHIRASFHRDDPLQAEPGGTGVDRVTTVFQDTGPGISAAELENIFNPFFTTKDKGTGLGLAITHKVITEHGGQIEVESALGHGSRFVVHLPV